jgi:hypothetical protein
MQHVHGRAIKPSQNRVHRAVVGTRPRREPWRSQGGHTILKRMSRERSPVPQHDLGALIVQRDDGAFQVGLDFDAAGPFPTRSFAVAVASVIRPVTLPRRVSRSARRRFPVVIGGRAKRG